MVTMTASITHCWKNAWLDLVGLLLCASLACLFHGPAQAQAPAPVISQLHFEHADESVLLTATVKFELSSVVEDALLKGVAMIFVADANIFRKRWYWTNKRVAGAQRHMRLAYQPLTRRWRLNVASDVITHAGMSMALNQHFDSLPDALTAMQRMYRWKIADAAALDLEQGHLVEFSFRLDISQLPRPLQIGTLGQSDWNISVSTRLPLVLENSK